MECGIDEVALHDRVGRSASGGPRDAPSTMQSADRMRQATSNLGCTRETSSRHQRHCSFSWPFLYSDGVNTPGGRSFQRDTHGIIIHNCLTSMASLLTPLVSIRCISSPAHSLQLSPRDCMVPSKHPAGL
jgi:hypothetical protein